MNSIKDRTSYALLKYYNSHRNLPNMIKIAKSMLESKDSNAHIRGEIAETILILILEEFKNHNSFAKDWVIKQGLILKDLDNPKSPKMTEVDVTVFTPKCVYLIECKSYQGNKTITGKGMLRTKNSRVDVYSQHMGHYRLMENYISKFKKMAYRNAPGVKLAIFSFSLGDIVDKRENEYKSVMPVLDETNILRIFNDYEKLIDIYNIKYLKELANILSGSSGNLRDKHLEYLKESHKNV